MNALTRRPTVGLAAFFLAGIGLGLKHPLPFQPLFVLTTALTAAAAIASLPRRSGVQLRPRPAFGERMGTACLLVAILCAGWLNAGLRGPAPPSPLVEWASPAGAWIEAVGLVTDQPERVRSAGTNDLVTFPLLLSRVRRAGEKQWHAAGERVRVRFAADSRPPPAYGEQWRLFGRVTAFSPGGQPARGRSFFILTTRARWAHDRMPGRGSGLVQQSLAARAAARRQLVLGIEDRTEAVTILDSLLLGYRSQMPRELYGTFAATGTLHIFAISGSHVIVLAAIIIAVLKTCRIPRIYWIAGLAPLLVFYTVMTGLQPSAVRACIMAVLFWAAPLFRRKADIYVTLALAAILITAAVPSHIVDVGCLLSFVAVLGLVLLFPVLLRPLARPLRPDPLRLQPEPLVRRAARAAWTRFSALFAASTAAWLVSVPLTAFYFQKLSLIGVIGNLVAIPLASLIIVTGAIGLVLGACATPLAIVFSHANLALVSALAALMRQMAAVPAACLPVEPPTLWFFLAFYGILIVWRLKFWMDMERGHPYKAGCTMEMPE